MASQRAAQLAAVSPEGKMPSSLAPEQPLSAKKAYVGVAGGEGGGGEGGGGEGEGGGGEGEGGGGEGEGGDGAGAGDVGGGEHCANQLVSPEGEAPLKVLALVAVAKVTAVEATVAA